MSVMIQTLLSSSILFVILAVVITAQQENIFHQKVSTEVKGLSQPLMYFKMSGYSPQPGRESEEDVFTDISENISDSDVLHFVKNGFVYLSNVIPSLKRINVKKDITRAFHIGKLEYTEFTMETFKKKGFDCDSSCGGQCGVFNHFRSTLIRNLSNEELTDVFDLNIQYLKCCLSIIHREYPSDLFYMPYFQALNGHRFMKSIADIALSKKLGGLAATLLQVPSVRLYQTAIFVKNSSSVNTPTEWHQDLNMVPVDVSVGGYLTFWCPLRALHYSRGDSILYFAESSHRDISRYHWFDEAIQLTKTEDVKRRYSVSSSDLEVGDCSVHHGWTLHAAPKHSNSMPRVAIGFSYVYAHARLLGNITSTQSVDRLVPDEDEISYEKWLPDLRMGDIIDHPLLPVVYPQ